MTVLCQCNVITEKMFTQAIEANRAKISDMPLNKAAAFIFNQVRGELAAQGKAASPEHARKCPKPCLTSLQILINEAEELAATAPACKGYHSPSGCAAADALAGLLLEMK